VLLFVGFVCGETSVLSKKSTLGSIRRLARRTRALLRNIENRAKGRGLHKRTRTLLRRLLSKLHRTVNVVEKNHGDSISLEERKRYTRLLKTITLRLSIIKKKFSFPDQVKEVEAPPPEINLNIDKLRATYLTNMKKVIKAIRGKYDLIVDKLKKQIEAGNAKPDDSKFKKILKSLQDKVLTIEKKLKEVRETYKKAKEESRKDKEEARKLKGSLKALKEKGRKTVKKLRTLVAKVKKAMEDNKKKLESENDDLRDKAKEMKEKLVKIAQQIRKRVQRVRDSLNEKIAKHSETLNKMLNEQRRRWGDRLDDLREHYQETESGLKAKWAKEKKYYQHLIKKLVENQSPKIYRQKIVITKVKKIIKKPARIFIKPLDAYQRYEDAFEETRKRLEEMENKLSQIAKDTKFVPPVVPQPLKATPAPKVPAPKVPNTPNSKPKTPNSKPKTPKNDNQVSEERFKEFARSVVQTSYQLKQMMASLDFMNKLNKN